MNEKSIHVRLDEETLEWIKALAYVEGADISKYARRVIEEAVWGKARKLGVRFQNLATPSVPKEEQKSHVYVLKCGDLYKIGKSDKPGRRLKSMQLPQPAELIASFESTDAHALEKKLHKQFKEFRTHGEWFKLPQASVAALLNS